MTTKKKPATPLPWESGMVESEPHCVSYFSIGQAYNLGGFEVAMTLNGKPRCQQDAAYIAHACNSYPGNIELLREAMRALEWHSAQKHAMSSDSPIVKAIKARLRELGED